MKARVWMVLVLSAMVALGSACDKDNGGEGEESGGGGESAEGDNAEPQFDDGGDSMAYNRCLEEIPVITAGLESGDISSVSCGGIMSYANRIAGHSDERVTTASSQIIELCGLQVPLAEAGAELAEAEAARAADPAAIIAGDCSMANSRLSRVHESFAGNEQVTELQGRIDAFCQ